MADPDLVFAALSQFTHTLVQRYAIADVLSELTDQVTVALDLSGAGVSVGDDDGRLRFVTCSSETLIDVERTQEAAQQGPCVDAYRSGAIVTSADLHGEPRWPAYRPVALRTGFGAVAAVPLSVAESRIGSLDLYVTDERPWPQDLLEAASLFADMAASYLANASDLQRSERIREQLQHALDSRVIIEQAKGLIAGQHAVPVDTAFGLLRRHTRRHNARLHDVAHAVVHLGLRIDHAD